MIDTTLLEKFDTRKEKLENFAYLANREIEQLKEELTELRANMGLECSNAVKAERRVKELEEMLKSIANISMGKIKFDIEELLKDKNKEG